jgi:hypothetical protein
MMTADKMTPPIPIEATIRELVELLTDDIVSVKFDLDSENPIPRLEIEFMRNVMWSVTYRFVGWTWHLQSYRMDSNKYKEADRRQIETTLGLLLFMEGGLNV